MIANVFLSSPALGTTKWRGPPLPEWAGIRADSRIIPALSLSGRAQVAIVDAKNGIKEGLQGNWFSCENNSGAQNTGAWVWITRPKSFMKRGAPRALRLKQSGSLPPLFLDNPPPLLLPPSLCPRPLGTVILAQIMTTEGKPAQKVWRKTSCLLFHRFPFPLWSDKGSRAIDRAEVCESLCRMSEQILDALSNAPQSRAKGSSVCIEKSCGERVSGLGGDMVLWRGPVLGWTWRVTERGSGVTDERDGRLVLCLWPTACSCGHHCGHAHLHTFGRSSGRQRRPREERPCLKWRRKGGQVDTQCMQIHTHTLSALQYTQRQWPREKKRLVIPVSTCKHKQQWGWV